MGVAGFSFLAIQFLPVGARVNPPVNPEHTIEAQMQVPEHVQKIINRSCKNCHSDATVWPWYSKIAPISVLVTKDVALARKTMNLSKWSVQAGLSLQSEIGILTAACADIKTGRMPMPRYVALHPEAKLSEEEKKSFCAWSTAETKQLVQQLRKQREKTSANRDAARVTVPGT